MPDFASGALKGVSARHICGFESGVMMRKFMIAIALIAGPSAAFAELPDVISVIYECERGVSVPATYINAGAFESVAVLTVEGRQVAMRQFVSGSGAKYAAFDEQLGYRWWTKGDTAFLSYQAADDSAQEVDLLMDCNVVPAD